MSASHEHIRRLLSLYYGGMTTPAHDEELRRWFHDHSEDALPADLVADRRVVLGLAERQPIEVPVGLGAHLSAHIDTLARSERRHTRLHRWMVAVSAAASVAIVLSIGAFIAGDSGAEYELTDPTAARNETERALLLVSDCLNKADKKAQETDVLLQKLGFDVSMFDDEEYVDSLDERDAAEYYLPGAEYSDTLGV